MRRETSLSYKVMGAVLAVLVFAACAVVGVELVRASHTSGPRATVAGSHAAPAQPSQSTAAIRAQLVASLRFAPAPGAKSVPPDTPIVVRADADHRITAVRVTSSSGGIVAGGLSSAADEWHSSGSLAYGAVYRVTATVTGASQLEAQSTATFQTLSPPAGVTASVFPHTGLLVGVGQPIVFRFSQEITSAAARANLIAHLSVNESRPVVGGWYWFSDRELHFRPKTFWPTGDHVTVAWDLTGWNAGGSTWGQGSGTSLFTIGASRVSFANLATDQMTVTENGRTIAVYPISGGRPALPTMNGTHIVLDRESVVHMVSSTNGVPVDSPDGYDELVYDDVHISDTGEYVHAAPWSVGSQGHSNVSHGCINVSPEDALAFFNFSRVGDIVVVTGSSRPPVRGDHGVMDWGTPWSAFTPASVIVPAPPGLSSL